MNETKAYLLSGVDDAPYEDMDKERAKQQWAQGEVIRIQRERIAALEAALTDIANADGGEANVMSSLRWIEGYTEGVETQAQRARAALGDSAPPQYPPSVLLKRIQALEAENAILLAAVKWYADKANWFTHFDVDIDDYTTNAETDGGERARKALGGGKP